MKGSFIKGVNSRLVLFTFLLLLYTLLLSSCTQEEVSTDTNEYAQLLQQSNSTSVTTHRWFYFTQDGFKETDIPRNAPEVERLPWTESIRVTSGAFIEGKAYFAVNKLGLIQAPTTFGFQSDGIASKTKLIKNTDLFSLASVADIYYIDDNIIFNFYTNSIFESNDVQTPRDEIDEAFLVEFNASNFNFSPILSKQSLSENIQIEETNQSIPLFLETEIREVYYRDNAWNILLKSNQSERTDFYALTFTAESPLSASQSSRLLGTMLTLNEYRETVRPKPSATLPQKMQTLLEPVPERVSYYLNYSEENSPTSIQYEHLSPNTRPIEGYALGFEHCSIAVFEDGTICFAGGLPSKGVLNNGETKAFKLPDLGPGYVYGAIVLSGSTLYASWEETSFYETGASGFLAVDMEQVLYENTITGE